MRGWACEFEMDMHGLLEARACFQKAIALDGRLAQAHIGLAGTYFWEAMLGWSEELHERLSKAMRVAQRAVAIDETDAAAHWLIGFASAFSGRVERALSAAERALELSPSYANVRHLRGLVFCQTGRAAEGVDEYKIALRLSPRDSYRFLFLHGLAESQYTARDYAAAAETAERLIALKPDYLYGHWHLAGSCGQLGQTGRARSAVGEVLRLNPKFDRAFVEAVAPYEQADLEHLIDGLRKAGWED